MMEDLLASCGNTVRVALNGSEGLHRLDERLPDLILLDVEMPVLNGPDMAYQMLIADAGRERIPIVLLSGVVDLPRVAARVGTPYSLGKPYGVDALLGLLDLALHEKTPPRPPH